ncbi:hypothetical protein AOCH_003303 [Aspergillus ochraceoroseus]|uniref:Fe2OG dioxygenase domain-containing protein n=1 Tax=Aspergillus ochraceoroseus TaxID=138278 RepID=A0A0F8VQ36_9EURO|nr:hypothetical protein AOCH_003303 [Aspergillus ochraceoroseus]
MEIPVLDYQDFAKGSQAQRDTFCQRLFASLSSVGFVKIRNHTIPEEVVEEVFSWSQKFFAMPLEQKANAAHPAQANPHRGWSRVGQEKLSVITQGKAIFDLKESFDQGPQSDTLYPNIWNQESDLPGFRAFMETFYDRCHELHLQLLAAIASSMSLPDQFFVDRCSQNSSELRLNHYPAAKCSDLRDGAVMRISSHTDFGTITLLFQDSTGGLEIEDQHCPGAYIPVVPPASLDRSPAEMIVNVGDCLQRWTNDHLRSANHRVTLPVGLKRNVAGNVVGGRGQGEPREDIVVQDRYSVAYFGKPNRDVLVGSIPALLKDDEEVRYQEDITAWQYNQSRLLQTY